MKSKKPQRTRPNWGIIIVLVAAVSGILGALFSQRDAQTGSSPSEIPAEPVPSLVTFNHDVAPLLFTECAPCHRPGEPAPFSLLTFEDARKRGRQLAKVTRDRYMPPFLPAPGPHEFTNRRRLSDRQIALIQRWLENGMPEGDAQDLPPRPAWPDGWQLGTPDLIVQPPAPYRLAADGRDVYRNLVIPAPLRGRRYIGAVELRPGTRAIHHVFIQTDRTSNSRRRDEQDPEVGFDGMDSPVTVESPSGHFLGWQPGRGPTQMPPGLPWTLDAGVDLVLQIHLQPTGKPELVQPTLGFYFTSDGPTNTPMKLALSSYAIDIPAGVSNYVIEDQFVLPVDVRLLAVLPHAHYLGQRMEGHASLPDGTVLPFLTIPKWDFNWQSDYRFTQPIFLPRGTRLSMRYTYDNSTNNVRNPHQPPTRVRYGMQSSDEMGELWAQVLTTNDDDAKKLQASYGLRVAEDARTFNNLLLEREPENARAHNNLGKALVALGHPDEALRHFREAARLKPDFDEALYHLGIMASMAHNAPEAERQLLAAVAANPNHYKARNNLGVLYMEARRLEEARQQFEEVLRLNPDDTNARANLTAIERSKAGN